MFLNLNKLYHEAEYKQTELANITGVSRYAISKALKPEYNDSIFVSDEKYYRIHQALPEFVPLPQDFLYYTRPILLINKYLFHVNFAGMKDTVPIYKTRVGKPFFLYTNKKELNQVFPDWTLPYCLNEEGISVPFEADKYPLPNLDQIQPLHKPISYKKYLAEPMIHDKALFDRYSPLNVRINMILYGLQVKTMAEAGKFELNILHYRAKDISFILDKDILESVFSPYLFIRSEDLEKAGIS